MYMPAEAEHLTLKGDLAFILDFAHLIVRTVFDGRQNRREPPRTGLIASQGHLQRQGVMRSVMIVFIAPAIKGALTVGERAKRMPPE